MVQHDLVAKWPIQVLISILVVLIVINNLEATEQRTSKGLFSSLFGAVVTSFSKHVKERQKARSEAVTASSRLDEAVNSIQKNFTLFGSVFTKVDNGSTIVYTNQSNTDLGGLHAKPKGVFDDIANGISSLFGGAGPAVDSGPEGVNLVPNNCWYRGEKYDCDLSLTCAIKGRKSLDLCNGGLIWTCCVDREKIDKIDPDLGALSDAKCGEIYNGETGRSSSFDDRQSRIVGGKNTFFGQHPWQVHLNPA
jgi:hypothetical protein